MLWASGASQKHSFSKKKKAPTDMHLPGRDAKPYQFTENREIAYRETTKLIALIEAS